MKKLCCSGGQVGRAWIKTEASSRQDPYAKIPASKVQLQKALYRVADGERRLRGSLKREMRRGKAAKTLIWLGACSQVVICRKV